jgi:membrane-associated phospholipid phosphatase
MQFRFFPSAALWIGLGAMALADLGAMAVFGFRIAGYAAVPILAVSAGAAALGIFYATMRPDERLAALCLGAAYLITYTLVAAILSYLGASLGIPLLDAWFARADAALGLDWLALLEFTNSWPGGGKLLRLAYLSSMLQILLVFLALATTRQLQRLADFLALFTMTSLAAILAGSLLPAAGASVYFDPPAALRDAIGQDAGFWHAAHFQALRHGTMRAIDPATLQGVVQFPSFHAALAVITAWALWRTRYVALPALALNALVIVSAVPVGGHHFIDVFAGIAVGAAAIALLAWRRGTDRKGVRPLAFTWRPDPALPPFVPQPRPSSQRV